MAVKCRHVINGQICNGTDIVYGFDMFQCMQCGGHSKMSDGTPTVPTSAIDPAGATYDGPGKELIDDPENPPFPATNARI